MNIKYFIATFATFASISAAQGASFVVVQKLAERTPSAISSEDFSFGNRVCNVLSEVFQKESSCIDNCYRSTAVELVAAPSSHRKRGPRSRNNGRRPNLFGRSPMSF
ncbi:hypothetical protein ABID39_001101 [Bartonella japonica]|uniref:Uncharacterized protein n=1 Tax=Bartonella japonica TaxID=357761 RepID=A0ABV2FPC3_9HYPH